MMTSEKKSLTYREAGVDIAAGALAVEKMKPAAALTRRPGVLGGLGGFGGLFAPDLAKYPDPVLVSGTDGVGTKLRVAFALDRHETIGQDVVAMCVNDILTHGAEPLFFLDYLAVGRLDPDRAATIVSGVAEGCRLAGCALLGGETAEMPGFYAPGEYDIAGFAVGIVNRDRLIDGSRIREGDLIFGLYSSGLHSNGFSLARRVFPPRTYGETPAGLTRALGEELLTPTRIYARTVLSLLERADIAGMVHITGGGLTENIPRVLPPGLGARLRLRAWEEPAVFRLLRERGGIEEAEMRRTFNLGIGYVLVARPDQQAALADALAAAGEPWALLGAVEAGAGVAYEE
ncbi:MAG: phosphoribosylformylglycinamidine cyclo-ligase [Gracilibacteraceae bacterium]|jgi:phosphoribosylformylglycinamidine cyclo-ligase|nr:phosphoribosylformylglycinamidine cyclo-ligase [Gracilibacteraceae bacterium]